jgi:maleate isomerase
LFQAAGLVSLVRQHDYRWDQERVPGSQHHTEGGKAMIKQKETYEVPYGYRARVGLIVVGPNLNPTPEISRMLPDYVQIRETRVHMDPVVNIEECSKLSGPLGNAAALLAEGVSSPLLGNRSAIAFACTAGSLVGGPGWDKRK